MNRTWTIREMQLQDVEQVTALEESCFSMPWKKQDFIDILSNDNRIYVVAVEKDEILGGCMLTDIVGEGDISNVAVWEELRGQGIATALLHEILRIGTQQRGIKEYTLEVRQSNVAAIALYEKVGFVSEGIRPNFYDKPKEHAVIMWKREVQK